MRDEARARAERLLVEADREIARAGVMLHPSTVAKRLNVHVETVRGWIRRRVIPSITLPNGHYRVTGATLDRLLAEKDLPKNPTGPTEQPRLA